MNQEEYRLLRSETAVPANVSVADLSNKTGRTLIWGYTVERDSFHVYLKDGLIHKVVYSFEGLISHKTSAESIMAVECVPDKRIYPEACDYEFCSLLQKKFDISMPFTNFNETRDLSVAFHGLTIEQL